MKIVCLMENTLGNELCQTEHGLSLYIETGNRAILADTGASGLFLENAEKLGVDLSKVEAVFLSHGHYDHGGGILEFQRINPTAKIVMQKKALGDFWHKSTLTEKYIGLDPKMKELTNLLLLEGDGIYHKKSQSLSCIKETWKGKSDLEKQEKDDIYIFILNTEVQKELKCWPEGNLVLKEKVGDDYIQDCFVHEQYIVIQEAGLRILISGCAHNGILNILDEYRRKYSKNPDVIISGFHMRRKSGYQEKDIEIIKETAMELKGTGILCYTGHCTGEEPYQWMKEIMGEQLQYIHCGDCIEF